MFRALLIMFSVVVMSGCATSYGPSSKSLAGGYSVKNLEGDIYRVAFSGNGYATKETVQTYWLYRCADLALEKDFDGFEILSHISLTQVHPVEEFFLGKNLFQNTQVYYMPMDASPKPELTADIRLLNEPLEGVPPRIFNAAKLKAALEPYVMAEKKCNSGNVCEHVHKYIHPEGTFDEKI